jgi:FkbM family methyltransferase
MTHPNAPTKPKKRSAFGQNRRLKLLQFAIAKGTLGGSLQDFVRNVFSPPCTPLASLKVERIDQDESGLERVWLKGQAEPLFFPTVLARRQLYQTLSEQLYSWQWHYYEIPETRVEPTDIVLDCGAAEGIFSFLVRDRAQQILCIEPLPAFQDSLKKTFSHHSNITVIPAALSNKPGLAYLQGSGITSTLTQKPNHNPVEVQTIDQLCEQLDLRPTYIKGDLEGFERKVIKGAKNTIRTCKPKIAITTYHRADDAEELMRLLKRFNPDYRFKLKGIEERVGTSVMLHAW